MAGYKILQRCSQRDKLIWLECTLLLTSINLLITKIYNRLQPINPIQHILLLEEAPSELLLEATNSDSQSDIAKLLGPECSTNILQGFNQECSSLLLVPWAVFLEQAPKQTQPWERMKGSGFKQVKFRGLMIHLIGIRFVKVPQVGFMKEQRMRKSWIWDLGIDRRKLMEICVIKLNLM